MKKIIMLQLFLMLSILPLFSQGDDKNDVNKTLEEAYLSIELLDFEIYMEDRDERIKFLNQVAESGGKYLSEKIVNRVYNVVKKKINTRSNEVHEYPNDVTERYLFNKSLVRIIPFVKDEKVRKGIINLAADILAVESNRYYPMISNGTESSGKFSYIWMVNLLGSAVSIANTEQEYNSLVYNLAELAKNVNIITITNIAPAFIHSTREIMSKKEFNTGARSEYLKAIASIPSMNKWSTEEIDQLKEAMREQ